MAFSVEYIYEVLDRFSGPLAKMTRQTNRFQNAAGRASKRLTVMSQKMQRAGASMANFRTMVGAAGAGMALKNLIGTTLSFEQAMNKVQSVTWANTQQMLEMRQMAAKLGRETQFSASQAAEAMSFLGMAGLKTSDILKLMPGMLDLAAAGSLNLSDAADFATNILAQFGMGLEEIGHLSDVLAFAAAKSNTNVYELSEAMKNVGATANLAGVNVEETTAALMILANAGIKGGEAGTQLMNAFRALSAMAPKTQKALGRLGIDPRKMLDSSGKIKDFTGLVTGLAEKGATLGDLFSIFDIRGAKAMGVLKERGGEALSSFTKDLVMANGTSKEMAKILMSGLPGSVKRAQSALESIKLTMMKAFIGPLAKGLEKLATFMSWMADSHPTILKFATIALVAVAALGMIVVPLGILLSMVGAMLPALGLLAAGFAAISWPITLVVVGVLALITGFGILMAKSEKFRKVMTDIASTIGALFKGVFNYIIKSFEMYAKLATGDFSGAFTAFKESIGVGVATTKAGKGLNNQVEVTGEIGVRGKDGAQVESAEIGLNQGDNLAMAYQ